MFLARVLSQFAVNNRWKTMRDSTFQAFFTIDMKIFWDFCLINFQFSLFLTIIFSFLICCAIATQSNLIYNLFWKWLSDLLNKIRQIRQNFLSFIKNHIQLSTLLDWLQSRRNATNSDSFFWEIPPIMVQQMVDLCLIDTPWSEGSSSWTFLSGISSTTI